MSPGNEIGLENLPGLLRPGKVVQKSGIRLKDMIEDTERLIIEESFHQYGCWKKTATTLGSRFTSAPWHKHCLSDLQEHSPEA